MHTTTVTTRVPGLSQQIDIYREATTPVTEADFKLQSEAIGQIKNAELLRGQLIDLATIRTENLIGLAQLDGKALDLDVTRQKNETKKVAYSKALAETSLATLELDELVQRSSLQTLKTAKLVAQIGFEKTRLEQSRRQFELELQAADIDLKALEIDVNSAKQLTGLKTKQTIDVPARRVA